MWDYRGLNQGAGIMGGRIEFGTLWNMLRNLHLERGVEVTELLKGKDDQGAEQSGGKKKTAV